MDFNHDEVLMVYFSDLKAENQHLIFKGELEDFKKKFVSDTTDWEPFDIGDSFTMIFTDGEKSHEQEVRVVKITDHFVDSNKPTALRYFICPSDLDSHKINFSNLNFDKFL